ncbi:uncharacterized protein LY89DRAFT_731778 [Mollisia scopiformis]|uniref:Uncharacterized protein n=1 Tax=Mollisia scopiformis TaxID=149040 RepID=A0A194XGX2_MOLSC|nr:uncharacterized protein LY89DRAFT_731778 [Mollisia scopiformis]KUJ19379.1 hypothetical protein LY89DRAFT_731778 [Mollisia scopiformis]
MQYTLGIFLILLIAVVISVAIFFMCRSYMGPFVERMEEARQERRWERARRAERRKMEQRRKDEAGGITCLTEITITSEDSSSFTGLV